MQGEEEKRRRGGTGERKWSVTGAAGEWVISEGISKGAGRHVLITARLSRAVELKPGVEHRQRCRTG